MMHELIIELQAALRARGCPLPVVERESLATTTWSRERIVVEHDEGGDSFGPVRGQHVNPKHRATRRVGAKIQIYAQSTKSGALEFEHRRRAEHVLDLVLVALSESATMRRSRIEFGRGRFVQPDDLDESEKFGGSVYELLFTFDRAVMVQTWAGDAQPTTTLGPGGIRSTTQVSMAGSNDDEPDAETACGA